MNKLFTKIGVAIVGIAMAVSVGVAIGVNHDVKAAKALQTPHYVLDPVVTGNGNQTDQKYEVAVDKSIDGITWNIMANSSLVPWRVGGKSITNTNREIFSKTAMDSAISKVELSVGAASNITVNSLKLIVASNSSFSNQIDEVTETFSANSTITFSPTSGTEWATDAYYKFSFNVTVSGSSNKYVVFNDATFYKNAAGSIDDVTISGTTSISSGYLGLATTQLSASVTTTGGLAETVSWTSDDTTVAVVDNNGAVRFLKNGSANITATSTVDTTVDDTVSVSASNLVAYTGSTDTGDFTDTSTWGTKTIADFSGTLTNISFEDGGSSPTKLAYNSAGNMRVYNGTKMTLTCSSAYVIEYIVATSENGNPFTAAPTTAEGNGYLFGLNWLIDTTADAVQSVTLTYSGVTAYIDTLVVYYASTGSCGITIDNPVAALTRGASGTFTATPSGATDPTITWSSSNSSVISINPSTGAYSVDFVGTTTITASLSCNEGSDSASFDVTVSGTVSVAEANTICASLNGSENEKTTYKVTVSGFITDLDPNDKGEGKENSLTLSSGKVSSPGTSFMIYGVYSSNAARNYIVLNGTIAFNGYLQNYGGTYEMASSGLTLVSYTDDAIEFAGLAYSSLNESCATGVQAVTDEQWEDLEELWDAVDSYSKTKLQNADSSYEYNEDIAHWMSRYTIIVGAGRNDFMNGGGTGSKTINSYSGSSNTAIIIVVIALAGLVGAGALLFLKKRKEQ